MSSGLLWLEGRGLLALQRALGESLGDQLQGHVQDRDFSRRKAAEFGLGGGGQMCEEPQNRWTFFSMSQPGEVVGAESSQTPFFLFAKDGCF